MNTLASQSVQNPLSFSSLTKGGDGPPVLGVRNISAELNIIHREGRLLQAPDSIFSDRVYLCLRGKRHWVCSSERVAQMGFAWPEDVSFVSGEVLGSFAPARPISEFCEQRKSISEISDLTQMREFIAAGLLGEGIEIGAGAGAFPVPITSSVRYCDREPYTGLLEEFRDISFPNDVIFPDVITEFENLDGIANESLDFVIACHVIEHTTNPIAAIVAAYRKLRTAGQLVLVVPDKRRTFDKKRPLTSLEHLIQDYREPNRLRDWDHYVEFFTLSFPVRESLLDSVVRENFEARKAIHYHVWDYSSFLPLLDWIQGNVCSWSHVWHHPPVAESDQNNEFYVVLQK